VQPLTIYGGTFPEPKTIPQGKWQKSTPSKSYRDSITSKPKNKTIKSLGYLGVLEKEHS
jgi:hypothetical protein